VRSPVWRAVVPILVALAIVVLPVPQGLTPNAWYYFALFAAVIVGLILEPLPAAAIGVFGVTVATALLLVQAPPAKPAKPPVGKPAAVSADNAGKPASLPNVPAVAKDNAGKAAVPKAPVAAKDNEGKVPAASPPGKPVSAKPEEGGQKPLTPADALRWALSGFSDGTVWLIFVAYMFAMGYEKTGLGRRLSLVLVKKLGKKTLGLGYAVALSDLVLSPFIPSNTARSGGTIYPIIENIPGLFGSSPENEPRKIGSYLMWTAIATTSVTSSLFLTGLAPNLLALSLVQKSAKISIGWTEWCTGFLPVGAILFFTVPYFAYKLYPPTIKVSADVHRWAGEELTKLGRITRREILMALTAVFALLLWIFGGDYFNATTVALMALSLMILTGVVTWNDVIGNKQAWNVLVWFGTLVTLAEGLNRVGFLKWVSEAVARSVTGVPVMTMVILLVAFFFLVHYMFASITAHVTGLLPVMLTTGMAVPGMPVKMFAMLLCYTLGIMGILTPYATGPSPIYYGSGYISRKAYWSLGLVFGVYFLAVLIVVGVPYLRYLSP
jgi:L-tartrate/succinate antiporter